MILIKKSFILTKYLNFILSFEENVNKEFSLLNLYFFDMKLTY